MREWQSLISTTNVLPSRTPILWPWVSLPLFPCTVLTRVLCRTVLNPKKKMAHFTKFWPSDLVEEVESVVRECVSIDNLLIFNDADSTLFGKFIERYNQRVDKEQPQATRVHKAAVSSRKPGRQNIDDTDLSSDNDDDDNYQQTSNATDTYIEEWNLYLNAHKAMPDDIGIVAWWGVCLTFLFPA